MDATADAAWEAILREMDNNLQVSHSFDPVVPQEWPSALDDNLAIMEPEPVDPTPSQPSTSIQLQHIPITREEFLRERDIMKGTFEKIYNSIKNLQQQLQAVTRDHLALTAWTIQVNEAMETLGGIVQSYQVQYVANGEAWQM